MLACRQPDKPLRKDGPAARTRTATTRHRPKTRVRDFLRFEARPCRGSARVSPDRIKEKSLSLRQTASGELDPIIQFPDNSQSLNPYSYILNNPLSGTDPTGYSSVCDRSRSACIDAAINSNFGSRGGRDKAENQNTDNGNQSGEQGPTGTGGRVDQQQSLEDKLSIGGQSANLAAQNTTSDADYQEIMGEGNPRQRAREAVVRGQEIAEDGATVLETINPADPKNLAIGVAGRVGVKAAGRAIESMRGASSTSGSVIGRLFAKLFRYPDVQDLRTGRSIAFPTGNLAVVPKASRVPWDHTIKWDFVKQWHLRGYATPPGGWDKYDVHHIHPRQLGGDNSFWNLTPVERGTHRQEFNNFWRDYVD